MNHQGLQGRHVELPAARAHRGGPADAAGAAKVADARALPSREPRLRLLGRVVQRPGPRRQDFHGRRRLPVNKLRPRLAPHAAATLAGHAPSTRACAVLVRAVPAGWHCHYYPSLLCGARQAATYVIPVIDGWTVRVSPNGMYTLHDFFPATRPVFPTPAARTPDSRPGTRSSARAVL